MVVVQVFNRLDHSGLALFPFQQFLGDDLEAIELGAVDDILLVGIEHMVPQTAQQFVFLELVDMYLAELAVISLHVFGAIGIVAREVGVHAIGVRVAEDGAL